VILPRRRELIVSSKEAKAGPKKAREANITRRALIAAGWVLPAVIVVAIPSKAFAEYGGPIPDSSSTGSTGRSESHGPGDGEGNHDRAGSHQSDP